MNESHGNFRERLLGAEQSDPTYREKYEKEVQAMLEEKLTVSGKCLIAVAIAICLGSAVFCAVQAVGAKQPLVRMIAAVCSVSGLTCAVILGWVAIKGTVNLKTHPAIFANITWGMMFIVMLLAMAMGMKISDPIKSILVVVSALAGLVMAGVHIILNRVNQTELKTRERLLRIEYRLAGIFEGMGEKKGALEIV